MASATPPTDGGYKPGFLNGKSSIGFPAMTAAQKKTAKPGLIIYTTV